jgi:ubiquitin carboxyl-terminal hydrolase 36/42
LELDLQPYTILNENNDVSFESISSLTFPLWIVCFDSFLCWQVSLKYDLYAVVVHTGFSAKSGHYFCFVRTAPDTWHKLDDSKVASSEFVFTYV